MRYPAFLKDGDTIGFAAPSFGCNIEPYRTAFDHAQEVLHGLGYRTVCGPNAYAGDGIGISTSPEKCGWEVTDMLCAENLDAVISCGGGELMCETLGHVDFEKIAHARPKWFMGFSDNTNLTFLLPTLCDTAAVYGPCAPTFGMEPWHEAIDDAHRLLRGEKLQNTGYARYELESLRDEQHPLLPYHCTEEREIAGFDPQKGFFKKGELGELSFSGRLIGGCLDILAMLCGTKYDRTVPFDRRYEEDGIVWFLEACDLNVFGIRRALWQLKNAGWFQHAKGFLIGRPLAGRESMMGLDHLHAVIDVLEELQVPILLDADIGHVPPMMPLIAGSVAEVRYQGATDAFHLNMKLQ